MRKNVIGGALIGAVVLAVGYTNCSSQHSFQLSDDRKIASLNTSGTIVINNGDEFTKSEAVYLSIVHASADKMYLTNDPTCETGGSWEPLSSLKPWTLTRLNSEASVYVKFSNDGALASDCLSDAIVHDNIAPTVTIPTAPAAYTNAQNVSVTLVSSDNGSGVDSASCTSSSKSTCLPTNITLTSPSEGPHSVTVTVRDRAGNISAPANASTVVDRTAPTVALNLTPSKISNQTASPFQFSGSDSLSGIDHYECRSGATATFASSTFQPCTSPATINSLPGQQKIEVRSVDRAGNVSTPASYDWLVDLGAPTVQITKYPQTYTNTTQATFEFVGTDDSGPLVSYQCKVDAGVAVTCSSPFTTQAGLIEGTHTFSVTGIDQAGNISAPATFTWTVDTTKPTLAITSKPSPISTLGNADFVLDASDSRSGIDSIECQIDSGGFKPCTSTPNYPALLDGDRKFDARAKDRAGNLSDVATYSWKIDTTKPTITIASGPAPWVNVRAASIEMTVADVNAATGLPAPTIQCKMNDGAFATCKSPMTYSGLNETSQVFVARAVDAAGNISNEVKHTWGIDLTPPAINYGTQPMSLLYKGDVSNVAYTATDSTSGLNRVQCAIDGSISDCTATYANAFLNLAVGNHSFNVIATDKAGNESSKAVSWQISDKYTTITQQVDVKKSSKLDVLIVIDNSGSMSTEHQSMASRFDSFVGQLKDVDWQIGIVTTDVSGDAVKKDGRLVEFLDNSGTATGKYVIDSSMNLAVAKAWFAATIQMPTNGSGNEQGVAASLRAAQRSQQTSNAISLRNATLFRPDAAFAILVVTDADETNPNGTETQNRPETLINFVKTTWPTKPFSFHSIIVPIGDATCKSKDGNEGYGYNYEAISKLTGGIIGTVCATDYGTQLKDIGKSSQDLTLSVQLTCMPLDLDRNGAPDLQIQTADQSAPPAFTLEGMRVKFATALPVGINTLTYNCVKAL